MTYEQALAALADPTRRAILQRLRRGPASVGELARGLPVSQPAVSRHLRVLREANLVVARREGARRIYRLGGRGLSELRAYVESFWDDVLEAFREPTEHGEGMK